MDSNSNQSNGLMDRREERRQRRAERRELRGGSGAWFLGAILIGLGVMLMLQNFNIMVPLHNWWALFILLPAVGAFTTAYNTYRRDGRLSGPARGSLVGGTVMVLVAAIFLFDLNWGLFGPALLVLAGVGVLVSAIMPS